MISEQHLAGVIGSTAVGPDGTLGTVGQVYLDDQTGRPEWATVRTGLFGTKEAFVPLAEADLSGQDLRVPYAKDQVKGAPHVETDQGHLSQQEEAELYHYYGLTYSEAASDTGQAAGRTTGRTNEHTVGHDTSGPTTDSAMTRSEEQLHVGTESVVAGRARLRKYVVTENVSRTVPVPHGEIRVEREPITDATAGAALEGPAISAEEHEVTLRAERPVLEKEAVPVERIRLDKETVTEQQQVTETVRKEH